MIQKKQFLAAALSAALMAGTLAGCGASAAGNDDAADGEKVQIQYWHINSENQGGATVQELSHIIFLYLTLLYLPQAHSKSLVGPKIFSQNKPSRSGLNVL